MNNQQILQQAHTLIQQQQYEQAYGLLQAIPDDPTAQTWLAKLRDRGVGIPANNKRKNEPQAASTGKGRNRLLWLAAKYIIPAVVVLGGFIYFATAFEPGGWLDPDDPNSLFKIAGVFIALVMLAGGITNAERTLKRGGCPVPGFIVGMLGPLLFFMNIGDAAMSSGGSKNRGPYGESGKGTWTDQYE